MSGSCLDWFFVIHGWTTASLAAIRKLYAGFKSFLRRSIASGERPVHLGGVSRKGEFLIWSTMESESLPE